MDKKCQVKSSYTESESFTVYWPYLKVFVHSIFYPNFVKKLIYHFWNIFFPKIQNNYRNSPVSPLLLPYLILAMKIFKFSNISPFLATSNGYKFWNPKPVLINNALIYCLQKSCSFKAFMEFDFEIWTVITTSIKK